MMNIRLTAIGIFFLLSVPVYAESYICIGEMATGFSFDKNKAEWKTTVFKTGKFLLGKRSTEKHGWTLKEVGEPLAESICEDFNDQGVIRCDGFVQFHMNRENLRFIMVYLIGYWTDGLAGTSRIFGQEGKNTPHLMIGKCSPFES